MHIFYQLKSGWELWIFQEGQDFKHAYILPVEVQCIF